MPASLPVPRVNDIQNSVFISKHNLLILSTQSCLFVFSIEWSKLTFLISISFWNSSGGEVVQVRELGGDFYIGVGNQVIRLHF